MGDEEITDQPDNSKVEDDSVNADDNHANPDSEQSFSDTVKALSNNSIKKNQAMEQRGVFIRI